MIDHARTGRSLFHYLRAAGLTLRRDGKQLVIDGDSALLTDVVGPLRPTIERHKAALLAHLNHASTLSSMALRGAGAAIRRAALAADPHDLRLVRLIAGEVTADRAAAQQAQQVGTPDHGAGLLLFQLLRRLGFALTPKPDGSIGVALDGGKVEDFDDTLKASCKANRASILAYMNAAKLLSDGAAAAQRAGRKAEAQRLWESVLAIDPESTDAVAGLALIYDPAQADTTPSANPPAAASPEPMRIS